MRILLTALTAAALVMSMSASALAEDLVFSDPSGDDFGPGTYKYPTDAVYTKGSFDLRKVEILDKGSKVEFRITIGAKLSDPWNSKSWPDKGNGFSLQMVQVYLNTTPDEGHTKTLPGINAQFAQADAWDKVVFISPQAPARVKREVKQKAASLKGSVVVPKTVRPRGRTIVASVKKSDLGGSPSKAWGVQVVMQSNEGYPKGKDILSRKVNEIAGAHRFGGGNDYECDPHVLDILVAPAAGGGGEKAAQKKAMAYSCGPSGKATKMATLPMVKAQ